MKLESVEVRRFQSLWDCEVKLGAFTVIVGPSNSGKSAFCRALRTLVRNSHDSSFVAFGAKASLMSVTLDTDDVVALERGKGVSTYRISNPVKNTEEVYAKSGTSVPDDVVTVLAMKEMEGDQPDPHFTTQFDGPFLLDVSGPVASKAIGDLTNVSMLAEAAREANRRRQDAQRLAKVRESDSEKAASEVRSRYAGLPARKKAVEAARTAVETAVGVEGRLARLGECVERVVMASTVVDSLLIDQDVLMSQVAESFKRLDIVLQRMNELESVSVRARVYVEEETRLRCEVEDLAENVIRAGDVRQQELLKEAGSCPWCGNKIT